jgi:TonB family protein
MGRDLRQTISAIVLGLLFSPHGGVAFAADDLLKVVYLESLDYPFPPQSGIQGTVVLRLTVNSSGIVMSSEFVSGSKILSQAAQKNVAKWRFEQNDAEKERTTTVIYNFQLSETVTCTKASCATRFTFEAPNRVVVEAARRNLLP